MNIEGFHKGLTSWIATFQLDGRMHLAYYEWASKRWRWAHEGKSPESIREQVDEALTENLKNWLKKKDSDPKSY